MSASRKKRKKVSCGSSGLGQGSARRFKIRKIFEDFLPYPKASDFSSDPRWIERSNAIENMDGARREKRNSKPRPSSLTELEDLARLTSSFS